MAAETVVLVQWRGWQTDSVVGTGRNGGAAGQQWTRTYGWWRIHLESHSLSASSFSASAPSPRWSSVLFMKIPHYPFWGYTSEHLSLSRLYAGWSWGVISFQILPRPLTYRTSEESYLQEPPYPFSYKLAISLGLVMNLKQTSLCPVGWVWKENLWVLKLVRWISSHLSSFWCIILSCGNRFALESRGTGTQPGFGDAQILPGHLFICKCVYHDEWKLPFSPPLPEPPPL